jgi:hypothetical protein
MLAIGSMLIVSATVGAQNIPPPGAYQPIPNFTGVGAGLQFRQSINDRFSGAQPVFPTLVSPSFANLPAEQDGAMLYCKDCKRATPCVNGGNGAWALGTRGQWSCATGALEAGLSANGNKITSLANGTTAGDALAFGQTSGGDLSGSLPNPTVATVLGGKTPIYSAQTGALINTMAGAKGDGSDAITAFNVNGTLNVKAFGAKGDATTDDTVALQTAASNCLGPNIGIPPGVYKHSIPLSYNCPNGDIGGAPFSGINGGLPGQPATTLTQSYDGPSVIIEAPNSNNITLAAPIVGSTGNSYSMNGNSNGNIELNLRDTAQMNWNGLSAFTVEGFLKITATAPFDSFFVLAQGGAAGHPEGGMFQSTLSPLTNGIGSGANAICTFGIGLTSSNQIGGFAAVGGTTFRLASTTTVSINTVYYVALQYDGANIKLWLTPPGAALGTPVATQAATGTVTMTPFEDISMPGINDGFHAFLNEQPVSPTGFAQSWRFSNASRGYTNTTTAPNANLASDGNASLLLNFPSKCTSIGQANCSPDNMVEGVSGAIGQNVYLPVHGGNEANSVNAASIHDLYLNGGGIYSNWCVNCVWSRIEVAGPREEAFDCNNNCFQTTWDHLHAVSPSVAFDVGESSHDMLLIRPFADDPQIGIFGGNWNAVITEPEVTDRGNIVLPFFLSVFKGVIDEDVLDVESGNTNYLTSAYIQNSWGPVVFNGGLMLSLNNNPAVFYDPYFGISYAPHFIGTVFANVGGSSPSVEVHQVAPTGPATGNSTPRQVIFDDTTNVAPYSDGNYVLSPCIGVTTLASGSGTFTAACVHANSVCSCNATHTCTVGTPSAGSVGITGTGTDPVQVACQ